VLSPDRVRAQLSAQRGGADVVFDARGNRTGGAQLLAVVTLDEDKAGRQYRLPTERDYEAVRKAAKKLEEVAAKKLPNGLNPIPDEPLPPQGTLGFRVQLYGMKEWGDLFSARQKLALISLAKQFGTISDQGLKEGISVAGSKLSELSNSICAWEPIAECPRHVFGRQAIPIAWDFAEGVISGDSSGSFEVSVDNVASGSEAVQFARTLSSPQLADARESPLPDNSCPVWFTDPPYYDAVPYADLSDFFFVWLRRALGEHPLLRNPFEVGSPLTPKCAEIVQDEVKRTPDGRVKDKRFFEESMGRAFAEGRRVLREDGIGSVVFAHKTTEGWEALISGMLKGGWTVTASWPITTEMAARLRARESAALAASVHLVCRPRSDDAGVGGWEDILCELSNRIGDWMERLSGEGIRGADLVFSCVGPALELFSKYDKVETAEGEEVGLGPNPEARTEGARRGFLSCVWEVVGRTALQQVLGTAEVLARNSAAGALEEDARLTALFLWTLQSTDGEVRSQKSGVRSEEDEEETEDEEEEKDGGKAKRGHVLIYDVVRRFAQPLGIRLENREGRIIETKKGTVRLIPVPERAEQLFGEAGSEAAALTIERSGGREPQYALFPEPERSTGFQPVKRKGKEVSRKEPGATGRMPVPQATTLDRVHMAMLLQAGGQATALRAMLEAEIERSPDFLRLANALSALYPKDSEEKRLLDAMLLACPK
jgi:putative DNA methylase